MNTNQEVKHGTLFVCDLGFKPYLTALYKNDYAFFSGPVWREYQVVFNDTSTLKDLLRQVVDSALNEFDTEEIWHFRIDWSKSEGFDNHSIFKDIWRHRETCSSAIYDGQLNNRGHWMGAISPNNLDCKFTPTLSNGLGTVREVPLYDCNIEDMDE